MVWTWLTTTAMAGSAAGGSVAEALDVPLWETDGDPCEAASEALSAGDSLPDLRRASACGTVDGSRWGDNGSYANYQRFLALGQEGRTRLAAGDHWGAIVDSVAEIRLAQDLRTGGWMD